MRVTLLRKCCFDMRMNVDEVNRTGSRCGQDLQSSSPSEKGELKVPKVFESGLSPLEMSAFALNRGFSGTVGNR